MITIVAIGKKHESWVEPGILRYEKRLRSPFDVQWVLLPHASLEGTQARQEESERILSRVDERAHVILLDERGKQRTSETFSKELERYFGDRKDVCLVIGGAYGVNEALMKRANETWALSELVLPHQLVRLVLIEQLYRAQEIAKGAPYHHA